MVLLNKQPFLLQKCFHFNLFSVFPLRFHWLKFVKVIATNICLEARIFPFIFVSNQCPYKYKYASHLVISIFTNVVLINTLSIYLSLLLNNKNTEFFRVNFA